MQELQRIAWRKAGAACKLPRSDEPGACMTLFDVDADSPVAYLAAPCFEGRIGGRGWSGRAPLIAVLGIGRNDGTAMLPDSQTLKDEGGIAADESSKFPSKEFRPAEKSLSSDRTSGLACWQLP